MMLFLTDQFAYLMKLLNNNNNKTMKKFHKYDFCNQKKRIPKSKSKINEKQTLGYTFLKFIC